MQTKSEYLKNWFLFEESIMQYTIILALVFNMFHVIIYKTRKLQSGKVAERLDYKLKGPGGYLKTVL